MSQQQTHPCPSISLNSGAQIPACGLGLYKTDLENMQALLQKALDSGYRHFDTAIHYKNEPQVGQAFQNIFQKGKYKREDIFITSKVFPRSGWNMVQMAEQSLKDLQVDYVDLFLLHWPACSPSENLEIQHRPVHQVWVELEECVRKGYVKSIGVSNFNVQMLFDLLSYAQIKPSMNQIELHLYLQQPKLLKFCEKFNIKITAFCPLGRGSGMLEDENLKKIAKKYNKTPAQIALHHLHCNLNAIVIPKTSNLKRLEENFQWRDFEMDRQDIEYLKNMDKGIRFIDPKNHFTGEIPLFD
ncbi:NADP-dependent oxidoreductase domain [Pseudocohnilembus persalinus]|uniref:NADP-dependent oxidoreductase domain n=1 Tax=Pseudocohnilembus persalinus TaxID=266149 RepID=A0A0V0QSX2_PSEPJ|nr:NADP-dependent oxidoreductase domain [Pseudocohnilembus persalinus]|eukprot:KRX05348.1 NADP-dependent oxidoreductase domain [Pseudocohnilembus persalinus]